MGRFTLRVGVLLAMLFMAARVLAEPPYQTAWVRQLGTADSDWAEGVSVDGSGNAYITGWTMGSLGGPNAGSCDAFLSKYDPAGSLLWTAQLGTPDSDWAEGVSVDSSGSAYITGWTTGSLGAPNAGDYDAFLSKYDAAGSQLWTRQLGTSGQDYATGVSVDGSGSAYITGWTYGSMSGSNAGDRDAFLSKYDPAGRLLWTRQLGTADSDRAEGVSVDGSGNVYITGVTRGSLGGPTDGDYDAFLSKYDAAGSLLWTRQLGPSSWHLACGVSVDGSGNAYITGYTERSLGGPKAGYYDAFLSKYDPAGGLLWTRQLGTADSDGAEGVSVDGSGNAYITGKTRGSLGGPNAGLGDAFLSKYDPAGSLLWTRQLGTPYADVAWGVSVDGSGRAYITGSTHGSLGGPNAGGSDAWVARLSPALPPEPPPPPPPIEPANPPEQLVTYQFVVGLKPSLEFTPLTVGLDFELVVPAVGALEFKPSLSIPTEPLSPDLGEFQYSFHTNNAFWGKLLDGLAPIDLNQTAEGKIGIQGGVTAEAGVRLLDGESDAEIGVKLMLGVEAYAEGKLKGGIKDIPLVGRIIPDKLRVAFPIPGASLPLPELPSKDLPIGVEFAYPEFKEGIAEILGVAVGDLKTTVEVWGVPIVFNDAEESVFAGVTAKAVAFAESSLTFSFDAYFRRVTDDPGAQTLLQIGNAPAIVPVDILQSQHFTSGSGSVEVSDDNSVKMVTGSPAWITVSVDSILPVDAVLLEAQFDPDDGEGILSVYLAEQLIGLIDEGTVGHDVETYLFSLEQALPAGGYPLSYRLDPKAPDAASVVISNSSLLAVPEPSSLFLLAIGVVFVFAYSRTKRRRC